jgi:hypothetical protein
MRVSTKIALAALVILWAPRCIAQQAPEPLNPTAAVLKAFQTHNIVMIGEIHWNKQEWQWLDSLVSDPRFADCVDDIDRRIFGRANYRSPCRSSSARERA